MSKRKWDQPATDSESPTKFAKTEDGGKSATDAASAAAAIAAKIAAQFASPAYQASSNAGSAPSGIAGPGGSATFSAEERERRKDPHDAEFTHDIEINDVRNRYLLTKGATQQEIHQLTSASVTTKGVWYPDKSKATEKDPPLYLHISATTKEILDKAIAKVNELIAIDMGSLVEDRKRDDRTRERRKWPEEKVYVGLEMLRNFNVRAKVVGPAGMFVKHIQQETGTRVQIKGQGSGFYESDTGKESDDPMHIHITGPDEAQIARAKELANDLLLVVRGEHAKAKGMIQGQQQELHSAQAQYAAYNYGGYAAPQPAGQPPPPPSSAPPPAPGDGSAPSADGSAGGQDAYAAYWAAYGYDVNSPEFKQWQQQQYAQYYAQQAGTQGQAGYAGAGAAAPQPSGAAPEPSDAPPPPPPDSAPPPPPS